MWPFRRRSRQEPPVAEALLLRRIVLLRDVITNDLAMEVIGRLLFLQHEDAERPIRLWIESSGGSFVAGMAIVDTLRSLKPPVRTEVPAAAHGIAFAVLAAGCKGERVVSPAAKLSLTPVWSTDSATSTVEFDRARHTLAAVVAELSGRPPGDIIHDLLIARPFTPNEVVALGLADRVCEFSPDD